MKIAEFSKVAQMLAKEHKIRIEEGRGWASNIKERIVYYKKDDIYNLTEEHILGLILHEIAHIHYTTEVPEKEYPANNKELAQTTLNMIEDITIEHIIGGDYPNAGEILESTKVEVLDTLVKMLPKMEGSIHEKSLLYGAIRFDGRGYAMPTEKYETIGEKISTIMIARKDEIYNRKQTKDLMPLVKDILALIVKDAGQPTEDEKAQMRQEAMHGKADQQTQTDESKDKVIKSLKAGHGWQEGAQMNPQAAYIDEIGDQASMIGKQLRTVLKRNNAMEFGGRYRSGKLLAKRFVRIKALKDRHPFARRIIKSNQSYAFAIASDVSGSMFDGTSEPKETQGSYALSSMKMVGEALRLAGIPRAMITFGANSYIASPMGKTQIRWDQLASDHGMRKSNQNGTCIDRAIRSCTKELDKVRAERKIMIILTDGESDLYEMQEAHKEAIQAGIEPLGITIGNQRPRYGESQSYMDRTFSKDKNTTVDNTKNTGLIGKAFIDILKKSITKS